MWCDGGEINLRTKAWPSTQLAPQIALGGSEPAYFTLKLDGRGSAQGKDVREFMQRMYDVMESDKPTDERLEFFQRRRGQSVDMYQVNLGKNSSQVRQLLSPCMPVTPTDSFSKPEGLIVDRNLVKDHWTYNGRMASLTVEPGDPVAEKGKSALVHAVSLICQDKKARIEVNGDYPGAFGNAPPGKTPETMDIEVTPAGRTPKTFHAQCDDDEGQFCTFELSDSDLNELSSSAALTFAAQGNWLITVPFGNAQAVRKALPYCRPSPGKQVASLGSSREPASTLPRSGQLGAAGRTLTLRSSLNVRAAPNTSAALVKSLIKGTVISTSPSSDLEWSEVSTAQTAKLGFVKNSALERATQAPDNAQAGVIPGSSPGRQPQIGAVTTSPSAAPQGGNPSVPRVVTGIPRVISTSTLEINGMRIELDGIKSEAGPTVQEIQAFIRQQGGALTCKAEDNRRFSCTTKSNKDLSAEILHSGWGRTTPDASGTYWFWENEARKSKLGLWAGQ